MWGNIYIDGELTLNNVTFIDNYAIGKGGAMGIVKGIVNCNNSRFIDNYAEQGASIFSLANLNIYNTNITSKRYNKFGQIFAYGSNVMCMNVTFINITSSYSSAMYLEEACASIINSRFINLKANVTAGAIGTKEGGELYIENCEFTNTTSSKNGGAIYADINGIEANDQVLPH